MTQTPGFLQRRCAGASGDFMEQSQFPDAGMSGDDANTGFLQRRCAGASYDFTEQSRFSDAGMSGDDANGDFLNLFAGRTTEG